MIAAPRRRARRSRPECALGHPVKAQHRSIAGTDALRAERADLDELERSAGRADLEGWRAVHAGRARAAAAARSAPARPSPLPARVRGACRRRDRGSPTAISPHEAVGDPAGVLGALARVEAVDDVPEVVRPGRRRSPCAAPCRSRRR